MLIEQKMSLWLDAIFEVHELKDAASSKALNR